MQPNIPNTSQKRIVIVGAGFGGLALAQKLCKEDVQVVLIDKNNYHQFPPLFYQVATGGLEPSSISFPLRKIFQKKKNVYIRVTNVTSIDTSNNLIHTDLGDIHYDYLVLATGTDTNFFGNKNIQEKAIPMKSISEALFLRNTILQNLENAITAADPDIEQGYLNIVVAGGGPTGVEVSGTLAEMKNTVLPHDFPDQDFSQMNIFLMEGSPKVLGAMSEESSKKGKEYLDELGVKVKLNARVKDFDGKFVTLEDGSTIRSNTLVWATGVKANVLDGLHPEVVGKGGRITVDTYNRIQGYNNVFAIGDIALMTNEKYPNGLPQLAQPAIQQGKLLAKNILSLITGKELKAFKYKDLGSMATVGRNLAVVDLPFWKFQGFFAWLTWMLVHLMSIVGVKNRLFIFLNWFWNYVTYDQSLRLIIQPKKKS